MIKYLVSEYRNKYGMEDEDTKGGDLKYGDWNDGKFWNMTRLKIERSQ
jgi:hypothetical protein